MKKFTIAVPVLALTLLAGGIVAAPYAQSADAQKNPRAEKEISQAQRQEARKAMEASQAKMEPLRAAMFVKKQELRALQNAANPDVAAVSAKATEITTLQAKMADEKKNLGMALDTALGLEPGTHAMRHMKKSCGHDGGFAEGYGHGSGMKHGKGHKSDRQHGGKGSHDGMHGGMHMSN